MNHAYFKNRETLSDKDTLELSEVIDNLAFNAQGLIPVITQDTHTQRVLMMAWMNRDALNRTLQTGLVTYWSRSRQSLWVKGETSGHTQKLMTMSIDCDGDTLLCEVEQAGAACHTGRKSCFYLAVDQHREQVCIEGNADYPNQ